MAFPAARRAGSRDRYDAVVRLTAWEEERLLVFTAAELAGRHRAAGLALNAPEATALICEAIFQAARAGADYEAIERAGREAVSAADCLDGVPAIVDEVRIEVLMDEGTRLIVVRDPIAGAGASAMVPGQIVPAASPSVGAAALPPSAERARIRLTVRNSSARVVRVSSHFPFHRVNARLLFDRTAARGYRLDLPAGESLRWAPGEERDVPLVGYGGTSGAGAGEPA